MESALSLRDLIPAIPKEHNRNIAKKANGLFAQGVGVLICPTL
jgi:hypothetical protein